MFGASPFSSSAMASGRMVAVAVVLVTATIGRPSADVSAGGWLPSTGTTLYSVISGTVPTTAYIYTSTLSTCEVALNATATPGNQLSYHASSSMGNGITVALLDNSTVVASWSHALTTTDDLYTHILTSAQSAALASGTVTVQITAT